MQRKFIVCLALLCGLSSRVQAQTQLQTPTPPVTIATALTKQVHLSPDMTVRQAMQSLGDQMGIQIQLADYLGERHLTVQLNHVTAKDALDALAELEDWQWKEATSDKIRVERRPTLVPKEAAYIPRLIQAELPRDFRDYYSLVRPDDDPKKYYWSATDNQISKVSARLGQSIRMRLEQQRLAVEGCMPALQAGKKVYFTALTPREQERLALSMTAQAIYRTGATFWRGDLPPYVMDPLTASIELQGNETLLIGTNMQIGDARIGTGFGASVKR